MKLIGVLGFFRGIGGLVGLAFLLSSCSYPGGAPQVMKTRGYGSRSQVYVDEKALSKVMDFTFASKDEKFRRCVMENDTALAAKYATPANVNAPIQGAPPLFYAAAHGNLTMVNMLVSKGANVHARAPRGESPAYVAAAMGHPNTAQELVAMGAGTSKDVSSGRSLYAANREKQRRQNQAAMGAAIGLLGVMMSSSFSGGGGSSDQEYRDSHNGMSETEWIQAGIRKDQGLNW